MKARICINNKYIGNDFPVYIVAEISANHNNRIEDAIKLIRISKRIGADAVKLQTYTPDTLTLDIDNKNFQIKMKSPWKGESLYRLYQKAFMPWDWQPRLKSIADQLKIDLFSSAFDSTSVDLLERINVPIHKIASFEIVDIPLIKKMAKTGKPLLISTGMASLSEIKLALKTAVNNGSRGVALLKCTSAYPAPPEEMNLQTIPDMIRRFNVPIGLSDHSLGSIIPVAAVSMGASIIEKHITLSRKIIGPDNAFSMEPKEFKDMIINIRMIEKAKGTNSYGPTKCEKQNIFFRRSLFIVKNIKKGEKFTETNLRSIRPNTGLAPKYYHRILGRIARCDIISGTPFEWKLIR